MISPETRGKREGVKEGTEWGREAGRGGDWKGECGAATAGNFVCEFSACVNQ